MNHHTSTLHTIDGTELFTQSWTVTNPSAHLVLIHGLAEHSSRYQWVAENFNENDINVYSFDLRGHGKSGGDRVYISSYAQYLDDVHLFIQHLDIPNQGYFLLGHSMGGLIVTRYLLKYTESNCKGVILSAPALKPGDNISPLLIKISSIISTLFPKLKTEKLNSQFVSRDPKVVEDYNSDPLIYHEGVKAKLGSEMIKTMKGVRKDFPKFDFPILIMHGTGDQLADPQGSRWMIDEIASKDKKLEILPGFYHEILNEPEKEQVMEKLVNWIIHRT